MATYDAECNSVHTDVIRARRDGESVELIALRDSRRVMEAFLTPAKARIFARGILALADEIDGGEAEVSEPAPERIEVGDLVRVLRDDAEFASVKRGETFRVALVERRGGRVAYSVHRPGGGFWYFKPQSIELVTDEDAAQASEGEPQSTAAPSRASLLTAARDIAGAGASVDDLLKVAAYLEGN